MGIIKDESMLLGTNHIAEITSHFKKDIINDEIILLGTNHIAGITSDFKVDVVK